MVEIPLAVEIIGAMLLVISLITVATYIGLHSDLQKRYKLTEAALDRAITENEALKNPTYINPEKFPERGSYESRSDYLQRVWRFLRLESFVDGRIETAEQNKKVRQGRNVHQVYEDAQRTMQNIDETLETYGRTASFPNARRVTMDDIQFGRPSGVRYVGDSTTRRTGRPAPTHFEGVRVPNLSIFKREGRPEGWRPWMLLNVAGDGLFCGVPHYRPRYESLEAYRKRILAYVIDAYVVRGWSLERAVEFADHKWTAFQKDESDWAKLNREVEEGRAVPAYKTFHVNIMTDADKVIREVTKVTDFHLELACSNKVHHRKHEWTSRRKNTWHCPGA